MMTLLERNGGKKHSSVALFESALEELEKIKSKTSSSLSRKFFSNAKETSGAVVQGLSALRERGDKLELMGNQTTMLHTNAANYAQLAKQMKDKSKNNSKLFGRF